MPMYICSNPRCPRKGEPFYCRTVRRTVRQENVCSINCRRIMNAKNVNKLKKQIEKDKLIKRGKDK